LAEQAKGKQLDLLDKIWMKVKPEDKEDKIVANIVSLTLNALGTAASSLLLLGTDNKRELYFQTAGGSTAGQLKRLHSGRQSSIAEWVMLNAKPMMVNNPEKNSGFYKLMDDATGFRTRHALAAPLITGGKVFGVIEALNKTNGEIFSKRDLDTIQYCATMSTTALAGYRTNNDLIHSYKSTVRALVSLADAKETSGGGHSRRLVEYALMGARELGLSKKQQQTIEYAALLHDIGKLSIADAVLNKAEPLSDKEWAMIRRHPIVGYEILRDIPFLKEASLLILYHHEKYDGSGYPQGLHGDSIPIGARLIAVVDAFDNMTTPHAYKEAMPAQKAFTELASKAGEQFCPLAVKAFNTGYVRTHLTKKKRPVY
ncbi:MAG: HD domain-containing protein, partial [Dehalococcoidales bacterium]|nr:HD domain-containing protein [Dehalococcoidales bacterium]